jgi:fumarate hydratase class II
MAQQSSNGNRPKLSEKGLLTPDNCVVALIDHQGQMMFGTSNFDRQGIIGIEPNEKRIKEHLDDSLMLVTALNPHIGYEKAAKISLTAYREDRSLREAAMKLGFVLQQQFDSWVHPEEMTYLLRGKP